MEKYQSGYLSMERDAYGRKPIRRSFYVYPWMLEKLEKMEIATGITKRHHVLFALQAYIGSFEEARGKKL